MPVLGLVRRCGVLLVLAALVGASSAAGAPLPGTRGAPPPVTEPVQARAVGQLAVFTDWLAKNHAQGYIGEVGWPKAKDQPAWNAVGEAWFKKADAAHL